MAECALRAQFHEGAAAERQHVRLLHAIISFLMSVRRAIGLALFLPSVAACVQTAREVWQSLGSPWTESPIADSTFTFVGHRIAIVKRVDSSAASRDSVVSLERILIDGVAVGESTSLRMSTWPYQGNRRSPHWVDAVKFVNHSARDSSVWIARRLQIADTAPPRFEIFTLDAKGHHTIALRAQQELRSEYRLNTVTALVAEDPRPEFPLSVVSFVWFPYLWLVYPLGTGLLGFVMLRPARSARQAV